MIRLEAKLNQISLWQAANQLVAGGLTPRAKTMVTSFISLIESIDEQTANLDLQGQVMKVITQSGLQIHFEKDKTEQGLGRLENIDELINAASSFKPTELVEDVLNEKEAGVDFMDDTIFQNPLAEFLAQAALEAGEQQADKWEESVQLMTLHAAKGLEFPLVFMIGLEEGLFPSQQSQEDANRMEEERRLAYVGVTRAKQKLIISHASRRRMHGKEFYPPPSRFLKELPKECLNVIRVSTNNHSQATSYGGFNSTANAFSKVNETGYEVGSNVFHQKFGEGTILATEGEGDSARVQVHFKHAGSKWLVASFANLEKM